MVPSRMVTRDVPAWWRRSGLLRYAACTSQHDHAAHNIELPGRAPPSVEVSVEAGTIPLTVFRPFSISRFLIRANGPRR